MSKEKPIIAVVPKTPAECNQVVSILHSLGLVRDLDFDKWRKVCLPNEQVRIWTGCWDYRFKGAQSFADMHIPVNELYSVLQSLK